jgi:hypothetical protein
MFAWQQLERVTEEWYFLCSPCQYVISRTVGTMSCVARQSPAGKNASTEAEDIVGIRHQAMNGEDIAN